MPFAKPGSCILLFMTDVDGLLLLPYLLYLSLLSCWKMVLDISIYLLDVHIQMLHFCFSCFVQIICIYLVSVTLQSVISLCSYNVMLGSLKLSFAAVVLTIFIYVTWIFVIILYFCLNFFRGCPQISLYSYCNYFHHIASVLPLRNILVKLFY